MNEYYNNNRYPTIPWAVYILSCFPALRTFSPTLLLVCERSLALTPRPVRTAAGSTPVSINGAGSPANTEVAPQAPLP